MTSSDPVSNDLGAAVHISMGSRHSVEASAPVQADVPSPQSQITTSGSSDPLLWSWSKKCGVLIALTSASLLCDLGMTWGTTLFEDQARTWNMEPAAVANSISGGIFLQGPGGIFAVPLTQRFGRLPVLFWSQLLSCAAVTAAALCPSYIGFTICRCLQGLFNTAPQVIGLSIIHDIFTFKERIRMVNLWAFSFFCGPFLGPLISGLLVRTISWRAVYGILAGLHGLSLLLIIICGEETLYIRSAPASGHPPKGKIVRLLGIKPSPYATTLRLAAIEMILIAIAPHILLPTAMYTCVNFMWIIGIITTVTQFVKPPPYNFSDLAVALLFLAPFSGAAVASLWGHLANDFLQRRGMGSHNGSHVPESRLWATYPAIVISACGLLIYGQTLQHQLHWVGLAIGWAMAAGGALAGTTVISAYVLDCFVENAAAGSSWINFWRTTGGFCVAFFQLKWVASIGAGWSFGIQAGVLGLSTGAIVATQVYGKSWREQQRLQPILG